MNIEYQPYKRHRPLMMFMLCTLVIFTALVVTTVYLTNQIDILFLFLPMGVLGLWVVIWIWRTYSTRLSFSEKGIEVWNQHQGYTENPWEKFPYAYYVRDMRNNSYILLATMEITRNGARDTVQRMSNKGQIQHGFFLSVYLDPYQNTALIQQIKNLVDSKVPNISNRLG